MTTPHDASPRCEGTASGRLNGADGLSILLLTVVSAIMAVSLWGKLQTLLFLDPSWWLQEVSRVARGELPYRDFGWHFPPFAVMLYGLALRAVGIRFDVVQTLMDVISLGVVVLSYSLLRHYLSTVLATLTCLLLIAVCCTTLTYFSLFSLFGYSPALQTGALGLLLLLNGAVAYIEDGCFTAARVTIMAIGAFVALLSKPEPAIATLGIWFVVVAFGPMREASVSIWLRRSAVLSAAFFLPALAVYAFFINAAGLGTLAAAVSGYGLATRTCPWWPTGIGIWAGIAGCGAAAVLIVLGSVTRRAAWRNYLGPVKYALLCAAGLLGLGIYLGYEFYARAPGLYDWTLTGRQLEFLVRSMGATTDVFRAALWPAILYWVYLLGRGLFNRGRLREVEIKKLLFFTAPVLMSARSLFGTVLTPFPEVPAICYPFVILMGPYLLYAALSAPGDALTKRMALRFVATLTVAYIAVRIVAGYPDILSNRHYSQIETNAGSIKVSDGGPSEEIYNYVTRHTAPMEGILEIPYGGGIGFASRHPSPTYSTLFVQISPPENVQRLDVERMSRTPPAIVIAKDEARLGTYYGVDVPVGCEFPRIVWKSGKSAGDPNFVLPIVGFIRDNYHVERRIGAWQILRLNRLTQGDRNLGRLH